MTFWISQGSGCSIQVRWANVQGIDVKLSQDLTHQKSLNSVNSDRVIWKIKRWNVSAHSVYTIIITPHTIPKI